MIFKTLLSACVLLNVFIVLWETWSNKPLCKPTAIAVSVFLIMLALLILVVAE